MSDFVFRPSVFDCHEDMTLSVLESKVALSLVDSFELSMEALK